MTLAAVVNGARVVVPAVYSTVTVEDNLANVAPGARNLVILGEAAKGVPGNLLDLSGVYFTDYQSLKDYFGSGSIVDAGRMAFQTQASPVFSSSVNRLYVFKTNQSTRAQRSISALSSPYAVIAASEYGEDGNLISTQIQTSTTEILPTTSFQWVMRNAASQLNARVNGGAAQTLSTTAEILPSAVAAGLNAFTGLAATGGAQKVLISAGQAGSDSLSVAVDGTYSSRIVITINTTFLGADYASLAAGDILYIPVASAIAGAGSANVGAYSVVSSTASSITCDKISSVSAGVEVAPVQPVAVSLTALSGSQTSASTAELMVFNPIVATVDATTAAGEAAALELFAASGDKNLGQRMWDESAQLSPVSAAVALSASVSLTVSSSVGIFAITSGAFQSIPKKGDVLWVDAASVLAGASDANLGAWIVTAAGSTSVTARKVIDGGASVASVALASQETPFSIQPAIASTTLGAKKHISAAERQVRILASRQSDGATFPAGNIGGRVVLELSYAGTTATATISKAGKLTTSISGGSGAALDIQLAKYATMGDLVAYINTKTGYSARTLMPSQNSLNPRTVLDQVSAIGICAAHSDASYAGRIKADFYDFKTFIDNNFGLISYVKNTALVSEAGLPDADAAASFLTGGALGGSSNADFSAGLDACLKIDVTQVVPLISRDASKDIEDGLTDESSSYSIDAINTALKSHVNTASSLDYLRERFGMASIHASFADAKTKAQELAAERIQMMFQQVRTVGSSGNSQWFMPWMAAVAVAAGRIQAALGTSMLRKSFQVSNVKHVGDESIYSDVFLPDFDPDTKELDQAIEAGLAVLRAVTGFGVRMESPDLSTRSRDNDPKGWFYERLNVQFILDEVSKTSRSTLDNFIGNRTTDTSPAVIRKALGDVLQPFVSSGALKAFSIDQIKLSGNTYLATVSVFPAEAVEFIVLDIRSRRSVGETA